MIAVVAALLSYIPIGFISSKLGRKKVILGGILLVSLSYFLGFEITHYSFFVNIIFVFIGVGWAAINVNSYPMVVEMATKNGTGKYTGYYYFFSMLAAIISPILFGFLKDILGDGFLFIYSSVAIIIAMFFIMLVKHGEAKTDKQGAFESIEYME